MIRARRRLHVVSAEADYGEPYLRLVVTCPYEPGDLDAPCYMLDLECSEGSHCAHRPYDPTDEFKWDDADPRETCPQFVDGDVDNGHCGIIHFMYAGGLESIGIGQADYFRRFGTRPPVSLPFLADVMWDDFPYLVPVAEVIIQ